MKRVMSVRHAAVQVVHGLDSGRGSLSSLLPVWAEKVDAGEQALLRELCFGVARWSHWLSAILEQLMKKPLRNKDRDVHALLQIGLYQLEYMRVPDHAVLNQTVSVAAELGKPWARGLVNGSLRTWLRDSDSIRQKIDHSRKLSFPSWMITELQNDWPEHWESVIERSNERAPMTLRVNQRYGSRDQYQSTLADSTILASTLADLPDALVLDEPRNIAALPDFQLGACSVQDASAQRASRFMDPQGTERILDACAAPGGKTCHLLELGAGIDVTAIDVSEDRLVRVHENLQRIEAGDEPGAISSRVKVVCAAAEDLDAWWDGVPFDAVLLDAPCSGSGVVRRHPDIKLLRRPEDLQMLIKLQQKLLDSLWKTVKPGGRMLYATCSVFKHENEAQMQTFMRAKKDAVAIPLSGPDGSIDCLPGLQVLTGSGGADGFYYCLVKKSVSDLHES